MAAVVSPQNGDPYATTEIPIWTSSITDKYNRTHYTLLSWNYIVDFVDIEISECEVRNGNSKAELFRIAFDIKDNCSIKQC